ncbi:hypothetical protein GALMADRAFT_391017 [Galerina marginata CBS 339.88]|uniref:Uncharacterized protein n=1 Tax=Galerina marginata (strain CBS 339.88) TaxID=685588 RepID=A0A067U0R0_GALM3|nr:hypothetical protein GALMADRAFT_391017 [Galerina marginata CBS 339.88]
MAEQDIRPQDLPKAVKACQKDLTERVLSNLDKYLIEHMEGLKRERLRRERQALLENCLPILKDIYENFILSQSVNSVFPTTTEIFRHSLVQEVLDSATTTSTKDDFETIIPYLPHIVDWRKRKIDDQLRELITDACGTEYSFDPKTVLQLATTMFSCEGCHQYLAHPRVIAHSCANGNWSQSSYRFSFSTQDVDEQACWDILGHRYWNSLPYGKSLRTISFKQEDWKLMVEVITACGFDPNTTSVLEMDEADPILECISCNDIRQGRAVQKWSAVMAHKHKTHSGSASKMELALLEDQQEVQFARARMAEEQERRNARASSDDMICIHCKQVGNTIDLMRHVMRDHGICKPVKEDVVPRLDTDQTSALVYLWPPRIEEPAKELMPKSDGVESPGFITANDLIATLSSDSDAEDSEDSFCSKD